jgi:predicted dehydrogenase
MIKLGFLGGGIDSIAGKVHLIASQMDRKFKVIGGIFSKDIEKSKKTASIWKVKHFNSLKEMIEEVDLIVLLTPTPNHFEDLKNILKYPKIGVIADKPLVANIKEAQDIKNYLKDRFVVVTHNYSGYPLVREMRFLVQNNFLGNIKKIIVNMPQESFFKPMKPGYPQKWRLQDGEIPTIALDLGVHTFHLAKFIIQKDFHVFFTEKNSFSKYNVIDDYEIFAKTTDKKTLIKLSFSKVMIGNTNPLYIEVYGDKAGVKWSQNDFENLYITYTNGKKEILNRGFAYFEATKLRYQRMAPGHPSGFIEAFANVYFDIYKSYQDYKKNKSFKNDFICDAFQTIDSIKFWVKTT